WQKYYGSRDAVDMGINGDKTQNTLWLLDHSNFECVTPELAIVMIGENNAHWSTANQISEGVRAIIYKLRTKQPQMKILLLGIFYRGEKPNREQQRLAKTNELISTLADDQHVWYITI